MQVFFQGILLGLAITAPVGPTNVEVIRRGLRAGWKAASAFCAGSIIALIIYLSLVLLGFSYLAELLGVVLALTILGILVLAYLAFNSFREFFVGSEVELDHEIDPGGGHFIPGIMLTIANPGVLLFWTGIMGVSLAANAESDQDSLILSLGILSGAILVYLILVSLLYFGRRFLQPRYFKYVSLAAGVVLGFFCVKFALRLLSQGNLI